MLYSPHQASSRRHIEHIQLLHRPFNPARPSNSTRTLGTKPFRSCYSLLKSTRHNLGAMLGAQIVEAPLLGLDMALGTENVRDTPRSGRLSAYRRESRHDLGPVKHYGLTCSCRSPHDILVRIGNSYLRSCNDAPHCTGHCIYMVIIIGHHHWSNQTLYPAFHVLTADKSLILAWRSALGAQLHHEPY